MQMGARMYFCAECPLSLVRKRPFTAKTISALQFTAVLTHEPSAPCGCSYICSAPLPHVFLQWASLECVGVEWAECRTDRGRCDVCVWQGLYG